MVFIWIHVCNHKVLIYKCVEITLLQTEIEQLQGLVVNMKSDLDELERGRAKSRFSQTWKGQIWGVVDKIFAIYCIYKLTVVSFLDFKNDNDILKIA